MTGVQTCALPIYYNDLVLGTYGRGIWILDDITPLQQMDAAVAAKSAHLFEPRPAYRFQPVTMSMQFFPEASSGQDPQYGASLHYWMKEVSDTVKVSILITNEAGDTVRTLTQKPKPGLNRVFWDLRGEPTKSIVFRTKAKYADWVSLDENRTRKSLIAPLSLLMPPGKYKVYLNAGKEQMMQTLEVLKDPHSEGSSADIAVQHELMTQLYADLNALTGKINSMELLRRQVLDLKALMTATDKDKAAIQTLDSLYKAVTGLEERLIQLQYTGTGQDEVRYPTQLAEKLRYLATTVPVADFRPADAYYEVHKMLREQMDAVAKDYEALKAGQLAEVKEMMNRQHAGGIILED